MVRAILDGHKTQFRRAVKGAEKETWQGGECGIRDPYVYWNIGGRAHRCPYGQPGDRLWVRETFFHEPEEYDYVSGRVRLKPVSLYRADGHGDWIGKWTPSIYMPRWASRIDLELVSVRVERLNEISEGEAEAEGVERLVNAPKFFHGYGKKGPNWHRTARESFQSVWQSINGPGSWGDQWVWVVEFKRV